MSGRSAGRIFSVAQTGERTDRVCMGSVIRRCTDRRVATLARRSGDLPGQRESGAEARHQSGGSKGKAQP